MLAVGALGGASLVAAQSGGDGADENNETQDRHRPQGRAPRGALSTVFDVSGLDPSVFRDGVAEGLTVNEILAQNGLDSAVVQASALAALSDKLDEKVAAGDIDEARAAEILAKAEEMLCLPYLGDLRLEARRVDAVADAIGITVDELKGDLGEGSTIADVANANGVDPQLVIDSAHTHSHELLEVRRVLGVGALIATAHDRIDQAVADGNKTFAEGESLKAAVAERIATLVNEGRPAEAPQPGGA